MSKSDPPHSRTKLLIIVDPGMIEEQFEQLGLDPIHAIVKIPCFIDDNQDISGMNPTAEQLDLFRQATLNSWFHGQRLPELATESSLDILVAIHGDEDKDRERAAIALSLLKEAFPRLLLGRHRVECWHYSEGYRELEGALTIDEDCVASATLSNLIWRTDPELGFLQPLKKGDEPGRTIVNLFAEWLEVGGEPPARRFSRHDQEVESWLRTYLADVLADTTERDLDSAAGGIRLPLRRLLNDLTRGLAEEAVNCAPVVVFVDDQAYKESYGHSRSALLEQNLTKLMRPAMAEGKPWMPRVVPIGPEDLDGAWKDPEVFVDALKRFLQAGHPEILKSDLNVLLWTFDFVLFEHDKERRTPTTAAEVILRLGFPSDGLSWIHVASRGWRHLQIANLVGATGGLLTNQILNLGPDLFSEEPRFADWKYLHEWGQRLGKSSGRGLVHWNPHQFLVIPPYLSLLQFIVRRLKHYPDELWTRACRILNSLYCHDCTKHQSPSNGTPTRRARIRSTLGDVSLFKYHYDRMAGHPFWSKILNNHWERSRVELRKRGESCRLGDSDLGPAATFSVIDNLSPALVELQETEHLTARASGLLHLATLTLNAQSSLSAKPAALCPEIFEVAVYS